MSEPVHHLNDVPLEIWLHCFTYLSKPDILSLNQTNKLFHNICSPLAFQTIIFHLHRIALYPHGGRDTYGTHEDKSIIRHLEDRTSRFRSISNSPVYANYVDNFTFNGNFEGLKVIQASANPYFVSPTWQASYETATSSVIPGLVAFKSLRTVHLRTTVLDEQAFKILSKLPFLHTLHVFEVVFLGDTIECRLSLENFSIGGWRSSGLEDASSSLPTNLEILSPATLKSLNLRHESAHNHSAILHPLCTQVNPKLTNLNIQIGWDDMELFLMLLNNTPELESLEVKWNRRIMEDEFPQDILRASSLQRLHTYTGPCEFIPTLFPNRPIQTVNLSTGYWLWCGFDLEESATKTISCLGQTSAPVLDLVLMDRIHLAPVHFNLIVKYLPQLRKLKIDEPVQSWRMSKHWQDICAGKIPLPAPIQHLEIYTEVVIHRERKEKEYLRTLSGRYPSLQTLSMGPDD